MNDIFKKPALSIEDYRALIGKEIGVSSWHPIGQGRIDQFADVIEDHQFIHVDPVKARVTPMGGTVAHGFLTMSLLSVMSYEVMPGVKGMTMGFNYGFDKLRFVSPVKAGARVRGRFMLADATLRKPGELLSRTAVNVEIEGEKRSALVAEWLALIFFASQEQEAIRLFVSTAGGSAAAMRLASRLAVPRW